MSNNDATNNTLTGYGMAKMVNARLTEFGLKNIPPQMVYHYLRKNKIPSTIVGTQKRINVEDAEAWVEAYIARKLTKLKELEELEENVEA